MENCYFFVTSSGQNEGGRTECSTLRSRFQRRISVLFLVWCREISLIVLEIFKLESEMSLEPSSVNIDFKNRSVLVTGAGKGIGRDTAIMLAHYHAKVVALSRTDAGLKNLQDEIGCKTIIAELGDAAAAQRAAEQAGDIDLLVNNAAIAILQPFLGTTPEAWDATMAV